MNCQQFNAGNDTVHMEAEKNHCHTQVELLRSLLMTNDVSRNKNFQLNIMSAAENLSNVKDLVQAQENLALKNVALRKIVFKKAKHLEVMKKGRLRPKVLSSLQQGKEEICTCKDCMPTDAR